MAAGVDRMATQVTKAKRSPSPVRGSGSVKAAPASLPAKRHYVFGYGRISKSDGSQKAALQLHALNEAGCDHIFIDKLSGASKVLPQFELMLQQLRHGDEVIVWKLDRISRGGAKATINAVYAILDRGANFRSLTEEVLNSSGPVRDMMFAFLGAFAQIERNGLIERTKAGMQAAKAQGKQLGRRRLLNDDQVALIVELRDKKNLSFPNIAKIMGGDRRDVSYWTVLRAYERFQTEKETASKQKKHSAARPSGRRARVPAGSSRKPASRPGASSKRSRH